MMMEEVKRIRELVNGRRMVNPEQWIQALEAIEKRIERIEGLKRTSEGR